MEVRSVVTKCNCLEILIESQFDGRTKHHPYPLNPTRTMMPIGSISRLLSSGQSRNTFTSVDEEIDLFCLPFPSCPNNAHARLFAPMMNFPAFCMQQSKLRTSTLYPDPENGGSCFNVVASVLMGHGGTARPEFRSIESVLSDRVERNSTTNGFALSDFITKEGQPSPSINGSLKRPLSPENLDASCSRLSTNHFSHMPLRTPIYASTESSGDGPSSCKPGKTGGSTRTKDVKWLYTLEDLKIYKRENGDCIVPRGYSQNPRLASWVAEQRKQFKLMKDSRPSSITPERIILLDDVGFVWNAQDTAWENHMSDLKHFRALHGHCCVPLNNDQFPKLGLWVKEQRRHYTLMKQGTQSHMTNTRIRELDKIGFCWDTHEATWWERLRELVDFKGQYGSCVVPTNHDNNPKLGTWVHHQRRQYKKWKEGQPCHITRDRVRALENIGFIWSPRDKRPGLSASDVSSACNSESDCELNDLDLRPKKRQRSL